MSPLLFRFVEVGSCKDNLEVLYCKKGKGIEFDGF
jgi:hypothetical protein